MKTLLAALSGALLLSVPAWAQGNLRGDAQHYRASHERQIVGTLARLTAMKSVAADPKGLAEAADWLTAQLEARGFQTRQFRAGGSPPLVFGSYASPGATRTVVFYAHYDGQPVTPSKWQSDAFTPTMRDGGKTVDWQQATPPYDPQWRLYGRAAADDKSSIVAFLTAFDALKAAGRKPSINLKVVWEGEEEAGSPHLAQILKAHGEAFKSDMWLIGDGPVHQSRTPTIYFGARGTIGVEATIYGPTHALHDGHYGNWAPNPAAMAGELIAELRDDKGHIRIPGFYKDVAPLTAAEKKAIADLPPVEAHLKREIGIAASEGGDGLTEATMRPALNIRGLSAGEVGDHAKNAIPTEAKVSMDFRLVPDETPEHVRQMVEGYLDAQGWTVLHGAPTDEIRATHSHLIELDWEGGYRGLRADMSTPAARAVIAAARTASGGKVALLPMMGGSVPLYLFHDDFGVPVIGLPIANHDDSQHAPNENLRLQNLWDGVNSYAAMMGGLNW